MPSPESSIMQTAPLPAFGKQVSAQEVFMFFSDPSPLIDRAREALLGNCDWIVVKDAEGKEQIVLIEWIVREKVSETGEKTLEKTWVSPPVNKPLISDQTLWNAVRGRIAMYCNPYFLLNNPAQPEDLATSIALDMSFYLWCNWERFGLDISTAHTITDLTSDLIYGVLKGSEDSGYRKILTHTFSVNLSNHIDEKPPEEKRFFGLFGGK